MWADANIVKLVFITNDSETENQLTRNSGAWSRLATPVAVDDLRRDEALAFLGQPYLREADRQLATETAAAGDDKTRRRSRSPPTGRTMDGELAGRMVELVGGRILQLIAMKRDWSQGVSFEESADELKRREQEILLQVLLAALHCRQLYSLFLISSDKPVL